MSIKKDSAVQVQVYYQPDQQRMVRALLLLLGTLTTSTASGDDADRMASEVLSEE